MPSNGLQPKEAGEESLRRINRFVDGLGGELGAQASDLMARHGYEIDADGWGPHMNVLGHPLVELPLWLADATGGIEHSVLLDICESSLCGYLSVRAEDDYFDGDWDDADVAMMLSTVFRIRHQVLLSSLIEDRRFWRRFEGVWLAYGEAMLLERAMHDPDQHYGPGEFDAILNRSQPLEIPGAAVLSITGHWDRSLALSNLVRHLTKATQLLDDFMDAPQDLAAGNFTWVVRRLGGLEGERALRRGMIALFDEIAADAYFELDRALEVGSGLGMEISEWVNARKEVMERGSQRMYQVLFEAVGGAR